MPSKNEKQPLSVTHPELAKEADGWDPGLIVAGSHKRVSWHCIKGHTYIAAVQDRTRRGDKCSICAGKKVLVGFNDLKSQFPEIAAQAFKWNPEEYTSSSGKKMEWKCEKGHIWNAVIALRTGKNKTGCAVCDGKKVVSGINDLKTSHPHLALEADGWDASKISSKSGKKLPWQCLQGHKWNAIVADRSGRGDGCAVCSGRKVLGGFNDLQTTHPELAKEANGWDPSTLTQGSGVKKSWKCSLGHTWDAIIASRTVQKSGCPYCSSNKVLKGFNDLRTTHPQLATEVLGIDPTTVSFGSTRKANWPCIHGHQYEMSINDRVNATGCPICLGKRVSAGFNDLQTTHPEIAAMANGWDPTLLTAGSNKEREWKCSKSHTWKAPVYSLTGQGTRCPICSGQQFQQGVNDLQTTHPELAKEANGWDPSIYGPSSDKKLKWICPLGHTYEAYVYNRAFRGDKCSICSGKQVLKGFNDLQTTHPELAKEASGWNPEKFTAGSNSKVRWKCNELHEWDASINSRAGSHATGCPSCSSSGFDPNADGYLYFLHHSDWEMYQIGITNTPDDRLKRHRKLGWKAIELRGPMDGHLTQQWETAILRMLKANGADLSNSKIAGKFDGYSEAWSKATFEAKSIKQLMQLTEEFEENSLKKKTKPRMMDK